MPELISAPVRVEAAGEPPKLIDEFAGRASGEWVRYSTPEGAEYVAVCLPAFSPETVHRDD
jgi:hypothetical protein